MYSIMQTYHQWKNYILGKDMIIHTNHSPLQFIHMYEKNIEWVLSKVVQIPSIAPHKHQVQEQ